jgi:predicted phage terminase large subunit-like protein
MAGKTSTKDIKAQVEAAEIRLRILRSQERMVDFCQSTMPHPLDPTNWGKSLYSVEQHHELLCQALDRVATGESLRLAISMPPQHGKSETASRRFPAYFMGRFPWKNLMFGTYSQSFANVFGGQVRDVMESPRYKQIFPECGLATGSRAKDYMKTTMGGQMSFVGRGSSGSGKPADIFIIDDPLKNHTEARSIATLTELWDWYTGVVYARCHDTSAIIIIHTRWSENDLIGRICDPDHPEYDPDRAKGWTYLNIPAYFEPGHEKIAKALGKNLGEALWPSRFNVPHLMSARKLNPRNFDALYQGKPAPDDGDYFTRDMIVGYDSPGELPKNLRKYAASDHAVTEKQENDPNLLGCVGVDENDEIWILPDLVWDHMKTDRVVEEIISQMRRHRPQLWWAEGDVIGKAIGPFLRRRMREEKVYCAIDPKTPAGDKQVRARSIQGMMQMRMVHFPTFAPWWPKAENELLKFPAATHDEFVDFMGLIGLGLDSLQSASAPKKADNVIRPGTLAWIKNRSRLDSESARRNKAVNGIM